MSKTQRSRMVWVVGSSVLALSGCPKQEPAGELVGVYSVSATLTENTCGVAALRTMDTLAFQAEIRGEQGIGYWQLTKQPAFTGSLDDEGAFRFVAEENVVLTSDTTPKRDLEPEDFYFPDQDADLDASNCALLIKQVVHGSIHRSQRALDAGAPDAGESAGDLSGDHDIEVSPLAGSDCTAHLAAAGGAYATFPCRAHYDLSGRLEEDILDLR